MIALPAFRSRRLPPAQSKCSSRLVEPVPQHRDTVHLDTALPDTAPDRDHLLLDMADSLRSPMPLVPPAAARPPGSETTATHVPSSKHRPGSTGRSRPPATERPDRAGGESRYIGSLWTPLCHTHLADHEPDAQPYQQHGPGILHNFAAPLPDQEQQSQGDQHDGAKRLLAPPVNRGNRRHRGYRRIDVSRRRRIGRLIASGVGRLVRTRVGRLERTAGGTATNASDWSPAWIARHARTWKAGAGNAATEVARLPRSVLRTEVQPVPYFVQPQRIGKGRTIPARLGRVKRLKRLVQDPRRNKQSKNRVVLSDADQHREDHHVDQSLEELSVVHRAHAGNQPQQRGRRWIGRARHRRHKRIGHCLICHEAWLAEYLTSSAVAHAVGAKGLAAILAKGRSGDTAVIYAIHTLLLPRIAFAEPPECAGRSSISSWLSR